MLLAIARGATEIWAIDLAFTTDRTKRIRGGFNIAGYPLRVLLYQSVLQELERAGQARIIESSAAVEPQVRVADAVPVDSKPVA